LQLLIAVTVKMKDCVDPAPQPGAVMMVMVAMMAVMMPMIMGMIMFVFVFMGMIMLVFIFMGMH